MKLSAPPPPPPEPNDPGRPAPAESPGTQHPDPPGQPGKPTEPVPLAWPAWYAGADFFLAILALVLAFLLASFVVRNSDVWLHLAAGKRLLAGEYSPGSDPFSYSAADRAWVNHSLLFDAGSYLLYGGSGATLVVVKALAVALAFGLLLGVRRLGFPLWPWAAVAGLAAVAAAPRLAFGPSIGSMLFLAVTLFLLFRVPYRPGSWRFPVAVGVTFWLWAMTDQWFFLGPLALTLVLVGELVQQRFAHSPEAGGAPADALNPPPDVPTLAKALGIGLFACMLNPHHVRVWELPFELVGAPGAKDDPRLQPLLIGPLDTVYRDRPAYGYNVNGLAYAVLFVAGGVALGLGGRLRVAHVALWVGFAVLSLVSIYAIPFFALVAVPLVAGQLNSLSARARLKTLGDPTTRLLLLGSTTGRVVCLLAGVAACVAAWPGWMHPGSGASAYARRVGWAVEADPVMVRAVEQIQEWRSSGRLPADARGVIASPDLANYCAWFAPSEKVFVNGRFRHHGPELPDFMTVRAGLWLFARGDEPPAPAELAGVLKKLGAEYVALYSGPGEPRTGPEMANGRMWADWVHWSAWYLDGRTTVFGWRPAPGAEKPTFAALRLDPGALAFGPGVKPLPPTTARPAPPPGGWETAFVGGTRMSPPGVSEALGWVQYKAVMQAIHQRRQLAAQFALLAGGGPRPWTPLLAERTVALGALPAAFRPDDDARTYALLALRAARRAVAADPDHPDGYYALAAVLEDRDLPLSDSERTVAQLTALRQCMTRIAPPALFRREATIVSPTQLAVGLASVYWGRELPGREHLGVPVDLAAFRLLSRFDATQFVLENPKAVQFFRASDLRGQPPPSPPHLLALDLVREWLLTAQDYAAVEYADDDTAGEAGKNRAERELTRIKAGLKIVEDDLIRANKTFEREKAKLGGGQPRLRDQVLAALRSNLAGEALRILTDKDTDLNKEFGADALGFAALRVALEMAVGRLEDAASDLADIADAKTQGDSWVPLAVKLLTYQKYVFEGNYAEAGRMLESLDGGIVGRTARVPPPADLLPAAPPVWPTGPATPGIPTVLGVHFWYGSRIELYQRARREVAAAQQQESEFFYRRGVLSLLEGDIPGARRRFAETPITGNKAWDLPSRRNRTADFYLRLIDEANKPGK